MAFSSITYTGDGTTTSFSVPFPYLFQGDVTVTVNGASVAFAFTSPSLITVTPAPVSGSTVFIKRTTDIETLVVEFVDGSTVQASDINTDATQGLYLAQESNDGVSTAVAAAVSANTAAGNANTAVATLTASVNTAITNLTTEVNGSITTLTTEVGAAVVTADNAAATANAAAAAASAIFVGDAGTGGIAGRVPAPPAGSAAAGKFLSANGTFALPPTNTAILDSTIATAVGFVGDGVTPNDTAMGNWLTSLAGTSGCLTFPAGHYVFSSAVGYTLSGGQSLTIRGVGTYATKLIWTGVSGGLSLFTSTLFSTFHIRDLSFITTQVSGGTGLGVSGVGANNGMQFQSDIINVDFQGNDAGAGGAQYWTASIFIHNWGSINGFNVNTWGPHQAPGGAGGGTGVSIEGNQATASYTTIINFQQSSFNYHSVGTRLGDYWQGVTFNQCNWNGEMGTSAVNVAGGATGVLNLLVVTNSQLNCGGSAGSAQISFSSPVNTVILTGNVITCYGNTSFGFGANVSTSSSLLATGNLFNKAPNPAGGSFSGNIGIVWLGTGGVITNNMFVGLATGVALQGGSSATNVSQNAYSAISGTQVTNGGSGNSVGVATA